MNKLSYLKSTNAEYLDSLLQTYQEQPEQLDPTWVHFFDGMDVGSTTLGESQPLQNHQVQPSAPAAPLNTQPSAEKIEFEAKVNQLIQFYRDQGHRLARMNPLEDPKPPTSPLSQFQLSKQDLTSPCQAGTQIGLPPQASLQAVIDRLESTYCGSIGIEVSHIQDSQERRWIEAQLEHHPGALPFIPQVAPDVQQWILKRLIESEGFENFLHTRYVAQKRFSVEGAESLIPTLDAILEKGAELGAEEFVLGMAHRGRLNVLVHLFEKPLDQLFTQFEGNYPVDLSLGEKDVKYHMGYSSDRQTYSGQKVHLSMASNPSHLEFVNPVVQGMARAKQTQRQDLNRDKVIPITIHGDAALSGQGVCYETLNLSQLPGYTTGGTLHIVINNQIGFTALPEESRSTLYCTDIGKMLQVPIFHVNGDDPEALWKVAQLAMEYRNQFHKDVFIDLICYRKYGHNEGDEPSFTQPQLYQTIKQHPSTKSVYAERLQNQGLATPDTVQQITQAYNEKLTQVQQQVKQALPEPKISTFQGAWKAFRRPKDSDFFQSPPTALPETELKNLSLRLNQMPANFHLHPKLAKLFEMRQKAVQEGQGIDWGNAEALAYASLLIEGHPVRLSGQDTQRGTFSHRHAVLHDTLTGKTYCPFNSLGPKQASYEAYNSHLSESGVLGFEYGYSSSDPHTLVIWEAQFGDFANGAQVIIDQFISSAESKWQRMSGLTLFLPHGYEGQGPEHSSGRMERFLQLAGKNNFIVVCLSTPSQLFHGLRRQIKRDFRKPMIVFTPKSLLRHPQVVSSLSELSQNFFQPVIDDPQALKHPQTIRKVLLCTGKVYYDLLHQQQIKKADDHAIIRIEQLYPWPADQLASILKTYSKAELFWVQEEHKNMGRWSYLFNLWHGGTDTFQDRVNRRALGYIGRDLGIAPAVGALHIHQQEQERLIQKAFL